ncbi:hypothetical protein [Streptomyces sp. NBC_01477]|uniref:hypothetical protein n=1 Tax=Streptomyces sp. NBC_01477 TaxID=2976015 RepID=UPI002E2F560B|nr:hypothetical protein [Streptomyces sp. NBC_01477]
MGLACWTGRFRSRCAALALGDAALVPSPAHAALGTVTCTGWSCTTYSPGMTDTVRPTTVTVVG